MGKRTLARTIAAECSVACQEVDASLLQLNGDITAILTNLRENQVFIVSRVSALRRNIYDLLSQAISTNTIEIVIGQGPSTRHHVIEVQPFTLICTSAKQSDCPPKLQNCFALVLSLQSYSTDALGEIAGQISVHEGLNLIADAKALIALHSGRCPHQVEVMIKRVARAVNKTDITEADVRYALEAFGIKIDTSAGGATLEDLDGIAFERLVAKLLAQMDFRAEMTKATGDGGIDVVAVLEKPIIGGKYLFQCKRYGPDNLIGAATIREFYGAVSAERGVKAS